MPETVTLPNDIDTIREAILSTKGTVFGATVKKRDGNLREFNARTFEDTNSGRDQRNMMLTVMEMNAMKQDKPNGYRTVSLEGVKEIRSGGKVIRFADL